MSYHYNQQAEYSQSSIRSLKLSLVELKNFYTEHFNNLNLRCISEEISQQEFFDEQLKLTNLMNQIRGIESQILEFNKTNNVSRKQLTESERSEVFYYYKTGNYTQSQLSEMYSVSQAAISGVLAKFKE
ncbi:hypothetical protein [Vibrio tasmaniensis]|uniref:hypothetical protein n=1 Tax=Vibrio tasmaniensis TaxID=212663 RepID=UPI00107F9521|nr:hypothetical protein [Vibrio tasmaniensis]